MGKRPPLRINEACLLSGVEHAISGAVKCRVSMLLKTIPGHLCTVKAFPELTVHLTS